MCLLILFLYVARTALGFTTLSDVNSLYVGELIKLDAKDIKKVEVSNKRVIKVSRGDGRTLSIQAKSKGSAVIYIWNKNNDTPMRYSFSVISGSALKKAAGIKEALRNIKGIKISSAGEYIYITGSVSKKDDLQLVDKITASDNKIVSYVNMEGTGYNSEYPKISTAMVELGLYDVNIKHADGVMVVQASARSQRDVEHGVFYLKSSYPKAITDIKLVPYQIDIDVKIVEVNRTQKRELGLETPSNIMLSRHTVLSNIELDSILNLYDAKGLAKVVSNPSLSANDGQTASFHVGGSIPIKLSSRYNASLDWKNYGVILNFTPKVISEDVVELSIESEFSSLDGQSNDDSVHGLLIRGVKTVVSMDSGRSVVISGLVSKSSSTATSGLPIVSDVPVLSDIFASNSKNAEATELAIIVTPSIRLKCEELLIDKRLESLLIESLEDSDQNI